MKNYYAIFLGGIYSFMSFLQNHSCVSIIYNTLLYLVLSVLTLISFMEFVDINFIQLSPIYLIFSELTDHSKIILPSIAVF